MTSEKLFENALHPMPTPQSCRWFPIPWPTFVLNVFPTVTIPSLIRLVALERYDFPCGTSNEDFRLSRQLVFRSNGNLNINRRAQLVQCRSSGDENVIRRGKHVAVHSNWKFISVDASSFFRSVSRITSLNIRGHIQGPLSLGMFM